MKHLLPILLSVLTFDVLEAQPSLRLKLEHHWVAGRRAFDERGTLTEMSAVNHQNSALYAEFEPNERWGGFLYLPFLVQNRLGEGDAESAINRAFGDVELGFQYHYRTREDLKAGIELSFGFPTGDITHPAALFTGDSEFNQALLATLETEFDWGWFEAEAGFNNRTRNFSDEFRLNLEIGRRFLRDRLQLMLHIRVVESFNNGSASNRGIPGLFSNNLEYFGLGPELYYTFQRKFGLSFRVQQALRGQNVFSQPFFTAGAFLILAKPR